MNHRKPRQPATRMRDQRCEDDLLVHALKQLAADPHAVISDSFVLSEMHRLGLIRQVNKTLVVTPNGERILSPPKKAARAGLK